MPDADDRKDVAQHTITLASSTEGVRVYGALPPDASDFAVIPWDEAIAVARYIIQLARGRGDLS